MKYIFLILMLLGVTACSQNPTNDEQGANASFQTSSKLSASSATAKEMEKAAKARIAARKKEEAERIAKETTIEITPSVYDFGKIPKNTPVSTVFIIKNTGKKPLVIQSADASCGCTVPEKPKEPILPGKSHPMKVTFTAEPYQVGQKIYKTVTVLGNFPGKFKKVAITGHVEK